MRPVHEWRSPIARDPYQLLIKQERWVEADRVRRLEPVGLLAAVQLQVVTKLRGIGCVSAVDEEVQLQRARVD